MYVTNIYSDMKCDFAVADLSYVNKRAFYKILTEIYTVFLVAILCFSLEIKRKRIFYN